MALARTSIKESIDRCFDYFKAYPESQRTYTDLFLNAYIAAELYLEREERKRFLSYEKVKGDLDECIIIRTTFTIPFSPGKTTIIDVVKRTIADNIKEYTNAQVVAEIKKGGRIHFQQYSLRELQEDGPPRNIITKKPFQMYTSEIINPEDYDGFAF